MRRWVNRFAGVFGCAAAFVKLEIRKAADFDPCDVDDAVRSFAVLVIQDGSPVEFTAKSARANISQSMAADIIPVENEV